ncbi:MAG TPA: hypothetical protein VHN18_02360 [Micromonosporaceae bacterium]|nr:hypothetical protein [Micromonosporaceae bacterium]
MGVDREVLLPDAEVLLAEAETDHRERPVPPPDDPLPAEVTAATRVAYGAVGSLLVGWFFFGLLVQRQGWINSASESLGTGFALLLAVSVIGTVRRSRR